MGKFGGVKGLAAGVEVAWAKANPPQIGSRSPVMKAKTVFFIVFMVHPLSVLADGMKISVQVSSLPFKSKPYPLMITGDVA